MKKILFSLTILLSLVFSSCATTNVSETFVKNENCDFLERNIIGSRRKFENEAVKSALNWAARSCYIDGFSKFIVTKIEVTNGTTTKSDERGYINGNDYGASISSSSTTRTNNEFQCYIEIVEFNDISVLNIDKKDVKTFNTLSLYTENMAKKEIDKCTMLNIKHSLLGAVQVVSTPFILVGVGLIPITICQKLGNDTYGFGASSEFSEWLDY